MAEQEVRGDKPESRFVWQAQKMCNGRGARTPGVTVTRLLLGLVLLLSVLGLSDAAHAGYAEGNMFSSGITNTTPAANAYGLVVRPIGGGTGGGGSGGPVSTLTIAAGVTTNTTSTPVAGVSGNKTYWAQVAGTGAVTATIEYFGCQTSAATYCVSLGTVALSGTTAVYGVPSPAVGSANYPYHYIATTNVTGTGATVSAGVNY